MTTGWKVKSVKTIFDIVIIFESFRRRYNYLCREDEAHGPPVDKEPKKVRLEHSQGKENGGEDSWDKNCSVDE